jgi:NitT/TauT family transport system substrate-binding protein
MPSAKRCFPRTAARVPNRIALQHRWNEGRGSMTMMGLTKTVRRCGAAASVAALAMALLSGASGAAEKIRFGLNWLPEGEHCGFFQAKAGGLYEKAGLDVELRSGGPDQNVAILVASGQEDMGMGSSFTTLNLLSQGSAAVTVAAFFQKDPQTLVAHPDQGIKTLADLKGKPIMVARFSQGEFWQFLKFKFGFDDTQLRPYTYNAAVFLSDPTAVQQGYVTEDEFFLGDKMPKPPVVLLLADYGYDNYATTVFATQAYADKKPAVVKAFADATAQGYQQCMTGDSSAGMKLMMAANPDHGEPLYHFKLKQMRERGMVTGGDAATLGIGAMTDKRWKDFFDGMVTAGIYPATLDYKAAYTTKFLDKAGTK